MATLLEDGDIDEWFDEQKQQLSEKLYIALEKGGDFEKEQAKFNKAFTQLLRQYDQKYRDATKILARRKRLRQPLDRVQHWWKAKKLKLNLWWKQAKVDFKQWRFEREYRRLFKIKQRKI